MGQFMDVYNKLMNSGKIEQARMLANQTVGSAAFVPQGVKKLGVGVSSKPDNVKQFELLGAEKALLYARKNKDYGDSFNQSLDEDGLLVSKIRMGDKYKRFCQLINNPAEVTEEKLRETLIDLSNYADMTIMWLDNKEEQEQIQKMRKAEEHKKWMEEHIVNIPDPMALKHNDAMDAMAHAIVSSGADWDGDIVNGQYMNLKEGVIGKKEMLTSEPTIVEDSNTYNFHINVNADDKTIAKNVAEKVASSVAESMKTVKGDY